MKQKQLKNESQIHTIKIDKKIWEKKTVCHVLK